MSRTVIRITNLAGLGLVAALSWGCEANKSENPLSPNVAGPIAGVSISVPAPVSPVNGTEVLNTSPLRLTFNNSSTNGVRPLWYVVELASDANFTSKLYTNGRVQPAEGTTTSVIVDAQLAAEATYFWRVRADDGANNTQFSSAAHFDWVVPVLIGAPTPAEPANNATTTTRTPTLTVHNGAVVGRAGTVEYRFEVATDQAFSAIAATMSAVWSPSGTTSATTPELAAGTLFYWRARGTNGTVTSAVSSVSTFRTPAAPAPGPSPGPSPPAPPPSGNRTPDPPPGQRLPLPDMSWLVIQVAAERPDLLMNSCQEPHWGGHPNNWGFMDLVVDRLRQYDTRWGYNWKRGNVGDPSMDVVDYHWGPGPDEGSTNVYIIDIIGGHCGPNPTASWTDVTDITIQSGTIGRWTSRGRW